MSDTNAKHVDVNSRAKDKLTSHPPLFIAGCGRSGTTYLKVLIDRHPDFFIPTESLFLIDYLRFTPRLPVWLWRKMLGYEFELKLWYEGPIPEGNDFSEVFKLIQYREMKHAKAKRWGQKTPRFIRYMDIIKNVFPGCKWILLYRDPRAVVASMLQSTRHTYSVPMACLRWKRDNAEILDMLRTDYIPEDVLLLKYEDLILDFDKSMERVFTFLDVDSYDLQELTALDSLPFEVVDNTVRKGLKPDKEIIDSWRGILNSKQRRYIETKCRSEIKMFGYTVSEEDTSLYIWDRLELMLAGFKDIAVLLTYLYNWPYYVYQALFRIVIFRVFSIAGLSPKRGANNAGVQSGEKLV